MSSYNGSVPSAKRTGSYTTTSSSDVSDAANTALHIGDSQGFVASVQKALHHTKFAIEQTWLRLTISSMTEHNYSRFVIANFLMLVQLCSFPFSKEVDHPTYWSSASWISNVTYLFGLDMYRASYARGEIHWFFIAFAMVALYVAAYLMYALTAFTTNKPHHSSNAAAGHHAIGGRTGSAEARPDSSAAAAAAAGKMRMDANHEEHDQIFGIDHLYTATQLIGGLLFVPLFGSLFTLGWECLFVDGPIKDSFGGLEVLVGMVALSISLCIATLAFFASTSLAPTVFSHTNVASRSHTRCDIVHFAMRLLLIIIYATADNSQVVVTVATFAASVAISASVLLYVPYFSLRAARIQVIFSLQFTWVCTAALLGAMESGSDTGSKSAASTLLYIASPMVWAVGALVLQMRCQHALDMSMKETQNPYIVELKVRLTMLAAAANQRSLAAAMRGAGNKNGVNETAALVRASVASLNTLTMAETLDGIELFKKLNDDDMAVLDDMYTAASVHIQRSGELYLFWGQLHYNYARAHAIGDFNIDSRDVVGKKNHIQVSRYHLERALTCNIMFDQRFLISKHLRFIADSMNTTSADERALAYLRYNAYLQQALSYDETASRSYLQFFAELQQRTPDVQKLHLLGVTFAKAAGRASGAYKAMLSLHGKNVQHLRMYGSFAMDVEHDSEKAEQLLARAQAIDDARSHAETVRTGRTSSPGTPRLDQVNSDTSSRTQASLGADCTRAMRSVTAFEIFNDRNAVVVTSAESDSLGVILEADDTMSRLSGYSRAELVGSNVSTLIPEPFASHHNAYMRKYVEEGVTHIMENTRLLFLRHKTGTLVPVFQRTLQIACRSENSDVDFGSVLQGGVNNAFVAVMCPVPTTDNFFFVDIASKAVTSWSAGCISIFADLGAQSHVDGYVPVQLLIDDYDAVRAQAFETHDGVVLPYHDEANSSADTLTLFVDALNTGDVQVDIVRLVLSDTFDGVDDLHPYDADLKSSERQDPPRFDQLVDATKHADTKEEATLLVSSSEAEDSSDTARYSSRESFDFGRQQYRYASNSRRSTAQSTAAKSTRGYGYVSNSRRSTAQSTASCIREHEQGEANAEANRSAKSEASQQSSISSIALNALHQIVYASNKSGKKNGLVAVRRVLIGSILLVMTLAIVSFFVSKSALFTYSDGLVKVQLAQDRRASRLQLVRWTNSLMLTQEGRYTPDFEAKSRTELLAEAVNFEELHDQLYLQSTAGGAKDIALNTVPSIPLSILQNGKEIVKLYSLHEAVVTTLAAARLVAAMALKDITVENSAVYLLKANQYGAIAGALNESANNFEDAAVVASDGLRNIELIFAISASTVMFIVLMFGIRPAITRVEKDKREVLELFFDIPKSAARNLEREARSRMQMLGLADGAKQESDDLGEAIEAANHGDGDNDFTLYDGGDDNEAIGSFATLASSADGHEVQSDVTYEIPQHQYGRSQSPPGSPESVYSMDSMHNQSTKLHRPGRHSYSNKDQPSRNRSRTSGRHYDNSGDIQSYETTSVPGPQATNVHGVTVAADEHDNTGSNATAFGRSHHSNTSDADWIRHEKIVALAKTTLLFILCLGYFTGLFFWTQVTIDDTLSNATEVNWAGRRAVTELNVFTTTRDIHGEKNATVKQVRRQQLDAYLETSAYITRGLIFGNPHLKLPGSIRRYQAIDALRYETACFDIGYYKSSAGCEAFEYGLMMQGLEPAIEQNHRVASRLRDVNQTVPIDLVNNADMNFLLTMARSYLTEALQYEQILFIKEATDKIDNFIVTREILLAVMCLTLVLAYLVIYKPMVATLHVDNERTTSMLLILPPEIVLQVKSIRNYITSRVTDSQA
jgi:PAS domain S-box-containing protein